LSSLEQQCGQQICDQCSQNCAQSCATSCENSIQQCGQQCGASCTQNCEQSCQNACQDSCRCQNVSCGSSSTIITIIPLLVLLSLVLLTTYIFGIVQAFNSNGPILLTVFGSCILSISLSGVRLTKTRDISSCEESSDYTSLFSSKKRRFTIHHSHHPKHLIEQGHEFRIGNKYFCTGCYGLLIGTVCAVILASFYIVFGITKSWALVILPVGPIFFIPIILRYSLFTTVRTSLRLLANSFFPIGWCILSISLDALFQNWAINVVMIIIVIVSAYLRSLSASKDNLRQNQ
jgi:hypothetical protein